MNKKRPLTNSYELIKGRPERVTTFIRDYFTIVTLVRTAIAIRRYINGYHPAPSPRISRRNSKVIYVKWYWLPYTNPQLAN